ncbi:biotin-dependent carboxyltransferase family protein [Amycolatopsis sp. WQ 127309]|uniref:5-oxoprolinase subunit C family protein n=1 Tax=Amycolatopsis sp. WQ 127309 TaxID=2932773 RepID=UPI001FF2ABB5|nr:biotin-dependent carboxyltransferase family protein [Amycolatopsis sp. WQ 127309]UOZ08011.1 biotin-dependent carboxyltransferase family protein [Amycolatopsis sp. WQ 127309]
MKLEIRRPGFATTVQDLGRPGHAALGVGRSGAADRGSFRLANRLVGNPSGAAGLEVTLGGLVLRATALTTIAVTGADCPLSKGGLNGPITLWPGEELALGMASTGLRCYVAVRGGIDVPPVLGSRSTDTLGKLGPPPLAAGMLLPIGSPPPGFPTVDLAPRAALLSDPVLRVTPGPRRDWFTDPARLLSTVYTVSPDSDRVGIRLVGPPLSRTRHDELPSEPCVPGSLQVPPSGQPILFHADHPTTGGYPVIAVVDEEDLDVAAQLRPGQTLRFSRPAAADQQGRGDPQ